VWGGHLTPQHDQSISSAICTGPGVNFTRRGSLPPPYPTKWRPVCPRVSDAADAERWRTRWRVLMYHGVGGWEVRHSNSKNLPYYFNPQTKESRWEPPADTDSEALKHYMGQYHTANLRHEGNQAGQSLDGKIRCAHLLVKHRDSRRPSSWREAQITRSKDDAMAIMQNHESKIRSGATSLGDLAVTESDCSSARKRGDL